VGKALSDAQVEAFAGQGFLAPVRVMEEAEAQSFRRRLEAYEQRAGGKLESNLRHKVNLLFPWCDELIRHPRILDCIEDIIGRDILCWNVHLFAKDPDGTSYVSWHQDAAYWVDPEPRPVADMDAAAVAAHKDAVDRVLSGLMAGTGKTEFRA
jgi:hypothetical protein